MPTTFNVISLGNFATIDPTEGNTIAENAGDLEGQVLGSVTDPLWEQVKTLSPGTTGFAGGNSTTAYDQDNSTANENFRLDGGALQTFDASVVYNATLTYTDGTTATITAVIFQDTAGNLYLAPEFSANADQTALEAKPIRSMSLDSLSGASYSGMTGTRETSNFAVCFAEGTRITTPRGEVAVQDLKPGDLVETLDHGPQPIRWIGARIVPATGPMAPVLLKSGTLGAGLPHNDMMVSRQHRFLLDNDVAARMTGRSQVLLAAHYLTGLEGISSVQNRGFVTYWHFMCDAHEIVFAEGAPAETLFLGPEARKSMAPGAMAEIQQLFPELATPARPCEQVRPTPGQRQRKKLVERLQRNHKTALQWDSAAMGIAAAI
ncbi:MAG: Hint domain-containing protein [Sulfitobacter sp.]